MNSVKIVVSILMILTSFSTSGHAAIGAHGDGRLEQENIKFELVTENNLYKCVKNTPVLIKTHNQKELIGSIQEIKLNEWIRINTFGYTNSSDNMAAETILWTNIEEVFICDILDYGLQF